MSEQAPAALDPCRWVPHRMIAVTVFAMLGFGAVCWRLCQVQVVEHEKWASLSESMLKIKRPLHAMRGAIRDTNGELLAHDKIIHNLMISTQRLRDFNDVRMRLAKLQKCSVRDLDRRLTRDQVFEEYRRHIAVVIAEGMDTPAESMAETITNLERQLSETTRKEFAILKGLDEDATSTWKQRLDGYGIKALTLQQVVERFYPCSERLTHVLGYVNYESADTNVARPQGFVDFQRGREGIEAVMNDTLRGESGYQWIERDSKNREITAFRGETQPARHGNEIKLTIDMHLQDIMEEVIDEAYEFHNPKRIVAVITDPHTGAILAMANRPHFDRETMKGTMLNLAIGAEYEPGSVFKIVSFTGALDQRLTNMGEMINCDPNQKALQTAKLKDHVSGTVTISEAFSQSSNRASYLLARRLGEDRYLNYTRLFGFGKNTGISLTGEVSGVVQSRSNWDSLTFSRMSIGHAVTATPLQMVMAVGAIANGGLLMKPQIVDEIRDQHGNIIQALQPEVVNRVCTERTAATMRQAMQGVVESAKGTGKLAALDGFTVAGKTGTSQRRRDNGRGYEPGHYCVSFAGFAPAENPQLCAIIVVDDPKGNPTDLMAGKLAAPLFAQLMQQCLYTKAVADGSSQLNSQLVDERKTR